jgi:hypothetical protein
MQPKQIIRTIRHYYQVLKYLIRLYKRQILVLIILSILFSGIETVGVTAIAPFLSVQRSTTGRSVCSLRAMLEMLSPLAYATIILARVTFAYPSVLEAAISSNTFLLDDSPPDELSSIP